MNMMLIAIGFNLTNMTQMYNNPENLNTVYVYGSDYMLILLGIIAFCELIRLGFFLYYQVLKLYGVK